MLSALPKSPLVSFYMHRHLLNSAVGVVSVTQEYTSLSSKYQHVAKHFTAVSPLPVSALLGDIDIAWNSAVLVARGSCASERTVSLLEASAIGQ